MLRLVLTGGASANRRRLLDHYGSAKAAIEAGPDGWHGAGLEPEQVTRLARPDSRSVSNQYAWLQQSGHHLIGWRDPDYPPLLRRISSPPLALFVDGDPAKLWHPGIAVVGSRSPTAGGRDNARSFAHHLAASGLAVISGMAFGIDAAAHEAALAATGITIAVLGTGPDIAYPRQHAALRERIAQAGTVVSEHPPGIGAQPSHFPSRNRIIAGLALGTLVVEAAERSGALITARQAGDYGREVFAVPGSIHNPLARGCHRLIREGAALVENAGEIVAATAPVAQELAHSLRGRLGSDLHTLNTSADPAEEMDADYQKLWAAIGHDPSGMDRLMERTGLTIAELSSMLLVMELDGRVTAEHGRYSRKSRVKG